MGVGAAGGVVLLLGGVLTLVLTGATGLWAVRRGQGRLTLHGRTLHLFGGPLDGLVIRNGQADITTLRGVGYPVPRRLSPGPDGALDCQDGTCYRPRMRQGRATVLLFDDGALRRTH